MSSLLVYRSSLTIYQNEILNYIDIMEDGNFGKSSKGQPQFGVKSKHFGKKILSFVFWPLDHQEVINKILERGTKLHRYYGRSKSWKKSKDPPSFGIKSKKRYFQ